MAKLKIVTTLSADKDAENVGPSYVAGGDSKLCVHSRKILTASKK